MYVVCHVHPAKAIAWNEMPFGRDIQVVPGSIVLDRAYSPLMERVEFWVGPQFTAMLPIPKLLWPDC